MAAHAAGEPFVLLSSSSVKAIELPPQAIAAEVEVRALGVGDGDGTLVSKIASGEALRPPSPVHLRATVDAASNLQISWLRRSRSGWAWVDEVDAPLGESAERYRIRVEGTIGVLETETASANASFDGAQLAAIGPGAATVTVVQIGDHAVSRPASLSLVLQ